MDFNADDVGFVPAVAGHSIENSGDTDVLFLEMFRSRRFVDFSLNNWMGRMPPDASLEIGRTGFAREQAITTGG